MPLLFTEKRGMPLKRKITSLLNKTRDISLQLFILITVGYFLIVLSIFTYRYQNLRKIEIKNIEKSIKNISRTFSSAVGKSLFEKKSKELIKTINTILKKDIITGIKITDPFRNHLESKGFTTNYLLKKEFPINIKINNQKEMIGYINYYSNETAIAPKLNHKLMALLLKLFFEFIIFTAFIYYFLRKNINKPLKEIVKQMSLMKPKGLSKMGVSPSLKGFDLLKDSFNQMISKISQHKKTYEEKNQNLKDIDLQKTNFFKNISVELQTPLDLIIEPLENLHQKYLEEEHFNTALKNSKKLYRLVEQLLDFQSLSIDKMTQKDWPINVFHFLKQVHFLFQSTYSFEDIDFNLDIENLVTHSNDEESTHKGIFIQVNPENLEKIIFNFLSNALKFTGEGGRITLGGEKRDNVIRIFVRDSGPGIPKDKQDKVFEIFGQIDPDPTSTFEGTGLGLALSKELTIKMKGKIGIDSEPGHGSEFYCEFNEIEYDKEELDILILEDEVDTANTLEIILEKLPETPKYKIALSSEEGRKILEENQVKLVIADSRLPGEGGISFLEFIRETQPQTRKILLTGDTDYEALKDAHNHAKVDTIIFKPWDEHFLLKTINELLQFFGSNIKNSLYLKTKSEIKKDKGENQQPQQDKDPDYSEKENGRNERLILVVDDIKDMRNLISNELKEKGFKVISRSNGLNGFEAAKQFNPDLIVTDWMMPIMNGPEMISKIKKDEEISSIPIIILTSKAEQESRIKGIDIGADNYLSKPFKIQELISNIYNLIELKENEKKLTNANKELQEKQSAIQNLLENLGQGFLIFNERAVVLPGCSEITKDFFGTDPTSKFFYDVISLSENKKKTFMSWIKNVWKGNFSFKDMLPLAPKMYEEEEKYIQLNYRPIYGSDGKLEKIICVATDKTQERKLETKTKNEREKIQMILKILKDPIGFQNVIDTTYSSFNLIEIELNKDPNDLDITYIYRKIHTLKALFGSFSVPEIPSYLNAFEDTLSRIMDLDSNISRNDIDNIKKEIFDIFSKFNSFTKKNRILIEQTSTKGSIDKKAVSTEDIYEVAHTIETTLSKEHPLYINFVDDFILENIAVPFIKLKEKYETLSEKKGKPLSFKISSTKTRVRQDFYNSFFEMSPYLLNCLTDYDLETTQEREILGKSKNNLIKIDFEEVVSSIDKKYIVINISSDGRGIDEEKFKSLYNESIPKNLTPFFKSDDLYQIFGKNFSQEIIGVHNLIEEVENMKGEIKISSKSNKGFQFSIKVPYVKYSPHST